MFPHRHIHKYTWTSPEEKAHNQIDHFLIDRRRYSSILHVRSFRGADCDTDHNLVAVKVMDRLGVSKQPTRKFHGEKFNLGNLNELEVRKNYHTEITDTFEALENLSDKENINRAWKNTKNIKTAAKESLGLREFKQHKPWFDEKCLHFLDQRRQAKMQWVQDPSQTNVDYLNNVRRAATRHFRNKKKAYLKPKIEEIETNSKIKSIRDL